MDKLFELLNDHQKYHSKFQMDNFITFKSGGTNYGMYKQSLRELFARYESLKAEFLKVREIELDIVDLNKRINNRKSINRNKLKVIQKKMELESLKCMLKDRVREFSHFYTQAKALKEIIGDLTPEKRESLEIELWGYQFKKRAAIDIISTGVFSNATVEMLFGFPPVLRSVLLEDLKDKQGLVEWARNLKEKIPQVCDSDVLPENKVKELINADIDSAYGSISA